MAIIDDYYFILPLGLILGVVVFVGPIVMDAYQDMKEKENCQKGIIENIESISAGGFSSPTKCIFKVNSKIASYEGSDCDKQIGDLICLK